MTNLQDDTLSVHDMVLLPVFFDQLCSVEKSVVPVDVILNLIVPYRLEINPDDLQVGQLEDICRGFLNLKISLPKYIRRQSEGSKEYWTAIHKAISNFLLVLLDRFEKQINV